MNNPPSIPNDEPRHAPARRWGMSRGVWGLMAGFCGFVEWAGWFATGGRLSGSGDLVFVLIFAAVGVVAILNVIYLSRRV